jgi:hypothetical protein
VTKRQVLPLRCDMVRAILDGRKTQHRRPPGGTRPEPGDILWVREDFGYTDCETAVYKADYPGGWPEVIGKNGKSVYWLPRKYMPRAMSRISLEITATRLERLQDITEDDAQKEGVEKMHLDDLGQTWKPYRRGFESYWDSVYANGGNGWDTNRWIWVLEFRRVDQGGTCERDR